MKRRCYNRNCSSWKYYGKKGVIVCKKWRDSFDSFYQWAMDNGYDDNFVIDRVDPGGNYCPENCRWITKKRNALRVVPHIGPRKKLKCVSSDGKQRPLAKLINKIGYAQLAEQLGVKLTLIYMWEYRESGRPNGAAPGKKMIIKLNELSKKHRISGLTIDYLIRL